MSKKTVIDESVLDELLKELGNALISSDVNVRLVLELRKNVKAKVNINDVAVGLDKRKIIKQVRPLALRTLCTMRARPHVARTQARSRTEFF